MTRGRDRVNRPRPPCGSSFLPRRLLEGVSPSPLPLASPGEPNLARDSGVVSAAYLCAAGLIIAAVI